MLHLSKKRDRLLIIEKMTNQFAFISDKTGIYILPPSQARGVHRGAGGGKDGKESPPPPPWIIGILDFINDMLKALYLHPLRRWRGGGR